MCGMGACCEGNEIFLFSETVSLDRSLAAVPLSTAFGVHTAPIFNLSAALRFTSLFRLLLFLFLVKFGLKSRQKTMCL